MLLGLLSDTHGRAQTASIAVKLLIDRGAQFLVHCGDVGSDSVLDQLAGQPAAFVWGNTDCDRLALARHAQTLGIQCLNIFGELEFLNRRIAVTHGDDSRLVRRVLDEQNHDYLLVGHTHVAEDRRIGRTRIINPGALFRTTRKTVALLNLATDQLDLHEIRT